MKADVNRLKTKVMSMQNSSCTTTSGTAKAACAPTCAIVNKGVTASICVGGNKGVWSNYVGQPIYNEIIVPNCANALKDYSGTCYNSMFRKKAVAFKHGQGFQGWGI